MSDAFRPASAGDPIAPRISAEWFNGVNRTVNTLRGGDVDLVQRQLASAVGDGSTVTVVNSSGSDIDHRGGVLKLDGLYFSYTDRPNQVFGEPQMKGVTPAGDGDTFVILSTPLMNGKPGLGIHTGPAFCRLNFTDDAHTKAQPSSTVEYLVSGTSGVPILWHELEDEDDTTGEQWALVMLGGQSGGSAGTSGIWWGTITTGGSACSGPGAPSTDCGVTPYDGVFPYDDQPEVAGIKNFYPDIAPAGAVACVSGTTLVSWSCGRVSLPT